MGRGTRKKKKKVSSPAKLARDAKRKERKRRRKILRFIVGSLSVFVCFAAVRYKLWVDGTPFPWEQQDDVKNGKEPEVPKVDPIVADQGWNKLERVWFENQGTEPVELWWWTPNPRAADVKQAEIQIGERVSRYSQIGHLFYFSRIGEGGSRRNALWQTMMERNTSNVVYHGPLHKSRNFEAFNKQYMNKTGRKWVNYWPREPVMYHYHNVTKGDSIEMITDRTQFHLCTRFEEALSDDEYIDLDRMKSIGTNDWDPRRRLQPPSFQMENDRFYIGKINGTNYCRRKIDKSDPEQTLSWKITNICDKGPNAFRIFDFLSDDEMDHIKNLGQTIGMQRSTVAASQSVSLDRTSQTVWLSRDRSFIVDNVIRRIADMIKIPQYRLFMNASSESMQLVHYFGGELYKRHYDYTTEKPHNRYITFLMYLNDVKEGGNTSFPKADESCRDENGYFGVKPIKGSVAFFYDLFPDGNADEKTQHYAEPPVGDSEKWMTNLWIWDKMFVQPVH